MVLETAVEALLLRVHGVDRELLFYFGISNLKHPCGVVRVTSVSTSRATEYSECGMDCHCMYVKWVLCGSTTEVWTSLVQFSHFGCQAFCQSLDST